MIKKMFPILLILLMAIAWADILIDGYSTPKQYEAFMQEGNLLLEEGLYVKAIEKYNNAYSIHSSAELYDRILDCYLLMGDNETYISCCKDAISRYSSNEKFYERVLQYYEIEDENKFIQYVVEYKNKFPDNVKIDSYYKQAVQINYTIGHIEEKPVILSKKLYLCFEKNYNIETEEYENFAKVKDLFGADVFEGMYKNIRLADNEYFIQDFEGTWSLVSEEGYVVSKTERKTITDIVGKAAGCYVVIENGKYTLMNNDMEFADMAYDYISNSADGVYAVCKDGKWAIVPDDVIVYEGDYPYEEVMVNSQGLCSINNYIVVKEDGKYFIINTEQKVIHESPYSLVKAYEDMQQTVFSNGEKYGYMYMDGSTFIEPIFDDAMPYRLGAAAVKIGEKWGYIDQYGNTIVAPRFKEVTNILSDGKALVLDEDGYWKILYIPLLENL